jgi:tRNA(adenine34) deaminase
MNHAYKLAKRASSEGEVPVGAVIIDVNNHLLSEGYNQVIKTHDPTAHAEMVALRAASRAVNNYRLNHTTLYVTLEPCCMCAGALLHARISRLVFATRDVRSGACGSVHNFLQDSALNHRIQLDEGMMQEACAHLLQDFFKTRRNREVVGTGLL